MDTFRHVAGIEKPLSDPFYAPKDKIIAEVGCWKVETNLWYLEHVFPLRYSRSRYSGDSRSPDDIRVPGDVGPRPIVSHLHTLESASCNDLLNAKLEMRSS
jgi:hypothetical protein